MQFRSYLKTRLLIPERTVTGAILTCRNASDTRDVPINRFQLLSRLGQTYLTDMISRPIDYQLHRHKSNENYVFGGEKRRVREVNDDDAFLEENEDTDADGTKSTSFLSQSLHGSRRHLQRLNALTIVSEKGPPHMFITVTCNPKWREIQEMLLPGQTAFDRPDIVDLVFKNRLAAFLHNIRAGKYLDDFGETGNCLVRREVEYMMHSIEYQYRYSRTKIIVRDYDPGGVPDSHVPR